MEGRVCVSGLGEDGGEALHDTGTETLDDVLLEVGYPKSCAGTASGPGHRLQVWED